MNTPTATLTQPDQPNVVAVSYCCCLPSLSGTKRADEIREDPFQAKSGGENEVPPQVQQRNMIHRSSTKESVATVYDLPPGWKAVTSRSRPDRTAFLNEFTGERISWVPSEPASTIKGEIRKSKRRTRINNDRDSVNSSESGNTVGRASFDQRRSSKNASIS